MGQKKKKPYFTGSTSLEMTPRGLANANYEMGRHFGFDVIDLRANMDGNITNFQLQRLGQIWWNKFLSLVVGLPLILVVGYGCIGFAIIPVLIEEETGGVFCLGVAGMVLVAYIIREAWYLFLLTLDIRRHQIRWVMGQAKMVSSVFYLDREYLELEGVRFAVNPKESGCLRISMMMERLPQFTYPFHTGGWYTVYYVPHSKTIVSAEVSRLEDFEARLEQSVITMGADGEIEVG